MVCRSNTVFIPNYNMSFNQKSIQLFNFILQANNRPKRGIEVKILDQAEAWVGKKNDPPGFCKVHINNDISKLN